MSFFSKLFGRKPSKAPKPEEYEGFAIYTNPAPEGGRWRIQATIEKEVDGQLKSHLLIRADVLESQEAAVQATIGKAKQAIDEQGDRLFG